VLRLNSGGARRRHGNRKWVTLRRWGDVHAGGESYARAGEGVTLEQLRHCLSVLITSAIETVTRDMIQKTWQEIEFRLEVSRATNVAHIEMY
jgi:hypothetical protein